MAIHFFRQRSPDLRPRGRVRILNQNRRIAWVLLLVLSRAATGFAAQAVVAHVDFVGAKGRGRAQKPPDTVIWLTPLDKSLAAPPVPGNFVMVQHDKMFSPHLQVMPVGSSVSFPNRDPFFHNVFSFFNGRRFDLGLYQSGQSRSVVFNRVGVSYIFCNIHPEMSAVIITLDTPYYGLADEHGDIRIPDVLPGNYSMQVWSEAISPDAMKTLARHVTVTENANTDVGKVTIHIAPGTLSEHLNKFGQPYEKHTQPAY